MFLPGSARACYVLDSRAARFIFGAPLLTVAPRTPVQGFGSSCLEVFAVCAPQGLGLGGPFLEAQKARSEGQQRSPLSSGSGGVNPVVKSLARSKSLVPLEVDYPDGPTARRVTQ